MSFLDWILRQPRWLIWATAFAQVGLIGWLDSVTGWEWSFFVFYGVPIFLVTWRTERRSGLAFAVIAAVVWGAAQLGNHPYRTVEGFAIAIVSRWFYFAVLAVAVAAVKVQHGLDRAHIASLERAQETERKIFEAAEREQQHLGRELHDNLGPHLAAIGYAAGFLHRELNQGGRPEAAKAGQICQLAAGAVSIIRNLARGIISAPADAVELAVDLEELARNTAELARVAVSFSETGSHALANPDAGRHLSRIAQEALNNAIRHGGARNVAIGLHRGENVVRLTVTDDGKGLVAPLTGASGVGLASMRFRARTLGGKLEVDSRPDKGTVVSCEIPNGLPRPDPPA